MADEGEGSALAFGAYQPANYPTVNFFVGLGAESAVNMPLATAPETYAGLISEVFGGSFFWQGLVPIGIGGEIPAAPPNWQTGATPFDGVNPISWPGDRLVTTPGPVVVGPTDSIILINQTIAAPISILLPPSASRGVNQSIEVKDLKGDANINNITFVPAIGETIDGFSEADAITNGSALIDTAYGDKKMNPLATGGWFVT